MTGNKLPPSDRADVGSHGNLRSVQQLRKYRQVRGHMTGSAVVINLSDRSGHWQNFEALILQSFTSSDYLQFLWIIAENVLLCSDWLKAFFFFWKILTFPFSRCHWNFEDIYIQFKVKLRHSGASSPFMWVSGSELEVLSLYRTTTKAESSSFEILTEKKARKMIAVKVNKELKKVLRWFSQKHQQSR